MEPRASPPDFDLHATGEPDLPISPSTYTLLSVLEKIYQHYAGTSVSLVRLTLQINTLDGHPEALQRVIIAIHVNEERMTKIFRNYRTRLVQRINSFIIIILLFCCFAVLVPQVLDAPIGTWERNGTPEDMPTRDGGRRACSQTVIY
jgi:hypothetical protein